MTVKESKKKLVLRSLLYVLGGMLLIFLGGATMYLAEYTLVSFKWPLLGAELAAAATALPCVRLWRRLTNSEKLWINIPLHIVVATLVLLFAFYGLNRLGSQGKPARQETAIVERAYMQTRHHSRRVRRGVYTRGDAYTVFVADVTIGGYTHQVDVSNAVYRGISNGDTLSVDVRDGLFLLPCVDSGSLHKALEAKAQSPCYKKKRRRHVVEKF